MQKCDDYVIYNKNEIAILVHSWFIMNHVSVDFRDGKKSEIMTDLIKRENKRNM